MSKLTNAYNKFQSLMFKPVDAGSLALFRILFGIILGYHAYQEAIPWLVHYRYIAPSINFTFPLFDHLHLKVLSEDLLLAVTKLVGISATLIALGLFFRFALLVFFVSFGYLFLLDKAYFNNHAYLILLLSSLLFFMGAARRFSMDALRQTAPQAPKIPFWNIFLLRAQICIVYFFAAIPKLYPDYLGGRQMSVWLITQDKLPFLKTIVPMDWAVIFFTYAALLFDLSIGLLLCYRRTRLFAAVLAIAFHLLNNHMFPIGIFPFLMIAALVLFIDPDAFGMAWQKIRSLSNKNGAVVGADRGQASAQESARGPQWVVGLMAAYLLVQVLVPLRHFLIPGNANWTKEGIRFSWMLMANVMYGEFNIVAIDRSTNENIPVDLKKDINFDQYIDLVYSPDMIYQYVQFLKKRFQAQGIEDPAIYVDSYVAINGRRLLPFIDPHVDLADKEYKFMEAADWILPPPKDFK